MVDWLQEEENVIVLTVDNFEEALEKYPNILVEFCTAAAPFLPALM